MRENGGGVEGERGVRRQGGGKCVKMEERHGEKQTRRERVSEDIRGEVRKREEEMRGTGWSSWRGYGRARRWNGGENMEVLIN